MLGDDAAIKMRSARIDMSACAVRDRSLESNPLAQTPWGRKSVSRRVHEHHKLFSDHVVSYSWRYNGLFIEIHTHQTNTMNIESLKRYAISHIASLSGLLTHANVLFDYSIQSVRIVLCVQPEIDYAWEIGTHMR